MTQPDNHHLEDVMAQLSQLEPTAADAPQTARSALTQLKQRLQPRPNPILYFIRSLMMKQNRRFATTLVTLVVLFGIAFSFPAVRAAANDFLGLFRVQKFSAISFSPDQLAVLENLAESGLTPGEFIVTDEPEMMEEVQSRTQAARLADMTVRTLGKLGEPTNIRVMDSGAGQLIIDAAASQELLRLADADPRLISDSLDGAEVNVTIFASVEQEWADGTVLVQTDSPIVEYPEGLDPQPLGEALLQLLGMDAAEARRLSENIDWTSTLLLPIPTDFATFEEVTVNGSSGLLLNNVSGPESALVWQENGVLYLLAGSENSGNLLELAESLQ
jgi:hypothetical protein